MVRRPDCKTSGSIAPPSETPTSPSSDPSDTPTGSDATTSGTATMPIGMFNAAYDEGGIGCTVLTVEVNTGVFIDHYAVVNFEGFRDMVDALGGVDICLPQAVDDPTTPRREYRTGIRGTDLVLSVRHQQRATIIGEQAQSATDLGGDRLIGTCVE